MRYDLEVLSAGDANVFAEADEVRTFGSSATDEAWRETDDALRRLGEEILDEPVPERLLAILTGADA